MLGRLITVFVRGLRGTTGDSRQQFERSGEQ